MNKFNFHFIKILRLRSKPESGSVTIASLGIIVFFVIAVFFSLEIWNILDTNKSVQHICQKNLLRVQKDVTPDLEKLLALNRTVLILRKTKITAKTMIVAGAATYNPALIAAGQNLLTQVQQAQRQIFYLQNFLLLNANQKMQFGTLQISKNILQELRKRQQQQSRTGNGGFSTRLNPYSIKPIITQLAVRKIASDDGPPEYVLQDQFMQKQALHIFWKYQHQIGLESGNRWKKIFLQKQNSCGASLEQAKENFLPVLIADRR